MAVSTVLDTDEITALAHNGRLATALQRLSRAKLSGLVFVEHADASAVISLREGVPVFIEDLSGGASLGDALLSEGVINPEEYAAIMEHALSDLTGSEDLAFADKAVELGVLAQAEVDAELQRRVRGQLIQTLAWDSARIEVDDDPDSLTGPEYPHPFGHALYMAVRTFYDDERVLALLGEGELYLRLLRPRAEVADELGLDEAERELLEAFDPPASLRAAVERTRADFLEAQQLAAMLILTEVVERSNRPWSAPIEAPSRARPLRAPTGPIGRYAATDALPEERLGSAAAAVTRSGAARPAQPVTPTRPQPAVDEDYDLAAPPEPESSQPSPSPAPVGSGKGREREDSSVRIPAVVGAPGSFAAQAGAGKPISVRPRQSDVRPRRLGAALKRLGKELEGRRAQTQQLDAAPRAAAVARPHSPVPASPEVAARPVADGAASQAPSAQTVERNAVRELIRRKRAVVSQQARASGDARPQSAKPSELMRGAQDALREMQFARAHELLVKACEAEPDNEVFKMYRLWAAFRASALAESDLGQFRAMLREKLNDDLHKGFAYYAMGHVMLSDKKDEAAEKFFRKAIEVDKTNRDAERHLRLIELRRKSAATEGATNKIFGIEIGSKKG